MEVDYKRVSDSDGEMTLSFTDCKELMRFLRITNCRSFALTHRDDKSIGMTKVSPASPSRYTTAIKASGTTDDTVMLATLKLICAVCSKNTERFA